MSNMISNRGGMLALHVVRGVPIRPRFQITYSDGTTPVDLTGWSGQARIRRKASDSAALANPAVVIVDPVNGLVDLDINIEVSEAVPAVDDFTAAGSQSVWDLLLIDGAGQPMQLLQGPVTGYLSPTQPDLP